MVILEDVRQPHIGEVVVNPRGLASDPLVLKSMYVANPVSMRVYSDRTPFLLRGSAPDRLLPLTPPARIVLERPAVSMACQTGRNSSYPDAAEAVREARSGDAPGYLVLGVTFPLPRGRYRAQIEGAYAGVTPARPVRVDMAASAGREILAVTNMVGRSSGALLYETEITVAEIVRRVEPRVYFGGSGTVVVSRVTFSEMD